MINFAKVKTVALLLITGSLISNNASCSSQENAINRETNMTQTLSNSSHKNSESNRIDMTKYLNKIQVNNHISDLNPSLQNLNLLTNKHVTNIPYQNFAIYFRTTPDISPISLEKKLLDNNEGGMCYETSELLFNALESLNFDVKRVPAFPLNNKPFNPNIPSSHNILLVTIDHEKFLIDVGYGNNSIRYPLKFTFDQTEEIEPFPNEQYQLLSSTDYYQLNLKINNEWASLYRFNRPLQFIDFNETRDNMHNMFAYKGMLPIRDLYLKASILTDTGRIGFYVEPENSIASAYKSSISENEMNKKTYSNSEEFINDLLNNTGINANFRDSLLKVILSQKK